MGEVARRYWLELQREVEASRQRIEWLESQRRSWIYFAVGVVGGCGLGALILTLAVRGL
jgi:hypothetical protein